MKVLLTILIAAILFASCSSSDHNIDSRFTSQQCKSIPQAQIAELDPGMQLIGATNPDGTVTYCDSMYTVSPSLAEKVALAKEQGTYGWGIALFVLCFVAIGIGCWKAYNQKTAGDYAFLVYIGLGIALGMGGASVIDWAHSKQADIHKSEYTVYMQQDGNLHEFWDKNLTK